MGSNKQDFMLLLSSIGWFVIGGVFGSGKTEINNGVFIKALPFPSALCLAFIQKKHKNDHACSADY